MSLSCKRSYLQIIGCILQQPSLLSSSKYKINKEDFDEKFHMIVFAAIQNLYLKSVCPISYIEIENFLSAYTLQYKIFNDNNGIDYISECVNNSNVDNFEYYYNRLKKFSLLREFNKNGINITDIYNDCVVDPNEQEKMQTKFDNYTLSEIFESVERKLINIKRKQFQSESNTGQKAGVGLRDLIDNLKKAPEMGIPTCGNILNTIVHGARLKKFYLRSSFTGGGKSRLSAADACSYAVPYLWDIENCKWTYRGVSEPTLYITTELQTDEIQTLLVAYVSGVSEDKILEGKYFLGDDKDEEERVYQAVEYIEQSPLWIEYMSDFNIEDIETLIRQYQINYGVQYYLFDYLHVGVKLLAEIASLSKGMKLREDQVLLMFSDRLKAMCNKYNIHIDTSTQLNGEYKNTKNADQTLLRGSKAIADKIDVGIILLEATPSDLDALQPILSTSIYATPNMVYHIYKVRRGKFTRVKLWMNIDLGTMRVKELFLTNNNYEIVPIESTKIEVIDALIEKHSVDEKDIPALTETEREVDEEDSAKTFNF